MFQRLAVLRCAIPMSVLAAPAGAQEGAPDTAQVTQADVREIIRRLTTLRTDGGPGDPLAGDDVRQDLVSLQEHAALAAPIIRSELAKSAELWADFATGVVRNAADDPDPPLGSHVALAGLIRFLPEEHREPTLAAAAQSVDAALIRAFGAQHEAAAWLSSNPAAAADDRSEREQRVLDASKVTGALTITSMGLLDIASEMQSDVLLESCAAALESSHFDPMALTLLSDYKRYLGLVLDQNPAAAIRIRNALDARAARDGGDAEYVAKTLGPVVDRAIRSN